MIKKLNVEDVKQLIVYSSLVVSTFAFIYLKQFDLAEKIIIAFLAIATNNKLMDN